MGLSKLFLSKLRVCLLAPVQPAALDEMGLTPMSTSLYLDNSGTQTLGGAVSVVLEI